MKRTIRLTESDLHRVIREAVKRVIKESNYENYTDWAENSGASAEDIESAGERFDDRRKGNSFHGDKLAYKQHRYKQFDDRGEDSKNKSALKKRTTKRLRDGWRF